MRKNNGQTEERMTREQQLIFDLVLKHSQLTKEELESGSRKDNVVRAKQLLMYLYRECLGMSLVSIGNITLAGDKCYNHTSVMHSCKRAKDRLFVKETAFCYMYDCIMKELKEHGFSYENSGCTLVVRYPEGYRIHDVVTLLNNHFKELNYEFV